MAQIDPSSRAVDSIPHPSSRHSPSKLLGLASLSATLALLSGCSGSTTAGPKLDSSIASRCDSVSDCDVEQTCYSRFPYERKLCTSTCTTDEECPTDSVCVGDLSDYDSQALEDSYCLVPCVNDSDCPGSTCDDRPAGERYCF